MELTEPLEVAVQAVAQRDELTMPNRTSFPSMFPSCRASPWAPAVSLFKSGLPALLGGEAEVKHGREDEEHGDDKRPALPPVLDHHAEGVELGHRNEQDGQKLQEIREGRGVLVGVGRVDVHEAARRW